MLVRVIPEINPNHASNLFYVKENYLAYAQSPEGGNVYRRSGMDARLLHSREFSKKILDDTKITGSNFCIKGLRGENPFYRKKGFLSLIFWNRKFLFHIFEDVESNIICNFSSRFVVFYQICRNLVQKRRRRTFYSLLHFSAMLTA